jgi:uncharacterized protein YjbJ (UPF0337 family)
VKWNRGAGTWQQARREIKQHWNKLTNDQIAMVAGQRDQLVDVIQECYDITRDDADRQVRAWEARTRICLLEVIHRPPENVRHASHC